MSESVERLDTRRGGKLWSVATLVVGATLWAQLFWVGMMAEAQFEVPRPWAFLAYVMPLMMLVVGVWSRAPVLLLTLFAGSFLPGLVLLAEQERMLLLEGGSMVRVGALLALFLAIASAGSGEDLMVGESEPLEVEPRQGKVVRGREAELRRFVWARLVVLVVLWVLPAYAVYQDAEIAAKISSNYADMPEAGRVFLGLVHFFVWSVAAYMMVLVPSLNVEYDRRRISRELRELKLGLTRRGLAIRGAIWVGVSLALVALVFVVR